MYCDAFGKDMGRFGVTAEGNECEVREAIRKERMILAGFASFVVTYSRRSGQSQNSTAHAERERSGQCAVTTNICAG